MVFGLQRTVDVLTTTQNLAALDLLLNLVTHGPAAYRDQSLEALLTRHDHDVLFGLVRHFHLLTPRQRQILLGQGARLSNAIRRAYLDSDDVTYQNACSLIRLLPDFEQIPLIVGALMKDSPRKAEAVSLLMDLAHKLAAEREPNAEFRVSGSVRRHFLQTLRDGMKRFIDHRTDAVPEAFLLVANDEVAEVRNILHSPSEPCHNSVVRILRRSDNPHILRWIFLLLRTRQPPAPVLNIISERDDKPFVEQLLNRIGIHVEPIVASSLSLIREVRWLDPGHSLITTLPEKLQAAAVAFAMKTGVPLELKLEIAALMLDEGHHLARQATAQSLAELPGADANKLLQACLDDHDPEVQLAATLQLRRRGIPNALALLIRQLDSPDERVRAASQHSLSDYTMARFIKIFERMDESSRTAVGKTILKIDPNAMQTLREEMATHQRQQRTRAAKIIRSLQLSDQFTSELIVMLGDEDYMVRREAIESLAQSTRTTVVDALAAYAEGGHELSAGSRHALEYLQRAATDAGVRQAANEAMAKVVGK